MTDHQTLEWLLTKLRNAESLLDYYTKRITELEAKPAVEPTPWQPAAIGEGRPPASHPVLLRIRVLNSDRHWHAVAEWSDSYRQFILLGNGASVGDDLVVAWMPIPECDK